MRARPMSIRTRLTLSYLGIFSLIIAVYIAGASALHYRQLSDQLYRDEVRDLETVEGLLYYTADGRVLLHDDYHGRPESRLLLARFMEVMEDDGQVLFRNNKLGSCDLGGPPLPHEFGRLYYARRLHLCDGEQILSVSHLHVFGGRRLLLRVAYSTEPLHVRLLEFLAASALAMPFALVIAGIAGYRLAGQALRPIDKMTRTAVRITANRLSERIPVENPHDELGQMARVLNGLLERLEGSFEKLKRFTSDVSHELRTPLASLRSVGEVGLQRQQDPGGYEEIIGSMLEEVAKLSSMIDTLLTMAHAESGEISLDRSEFPVGELVRESVGMVAVLAEEKGQSIEIEGNEETLVLADRGFLRMVLINLLDNAVKYSPVGSTIQVKWTCDSRTAGEPHMIELAVEDEGPGVPESAREKVFDRFYRVDEARDRASGGAGLGLAIAKWAVEAHGGTITLRAGRKGGALFNVRLPAAETVLAR